MEDHKLWSIRWSLELVPDLHMIPGSSVFLNAPCECSLTAMVEDVAGLLLSFPNEFFDALFEEGKSPPGRLYAGEERGVGAVI